MSIIRAKNTDEAQLSRSTVYRRVRDGQLKRIGRGLFVPAELDGADWDQLESVQLRPEATICLVSALHHYDLTDEVPDALNVAIPRGKRLPITDGAISWHQFDRGTFDLGRDDIQIAGTQERIGIYSAERTIADCFRLRSSIGYEISRDALKEWLRRGGKPASLMRVASELPRTKAPVFHALDMLA